MKKLAHFDQQFILLDGYFEWLFKVHINIAFQV